VSLTMSEHEAPARIGLLRKYRWRARTLFSFFPTVTPQNSNPQKTAYLSLPVGSNTNDKLSSTLFYVRVTGARHAQLGSFLQTRIPPPKIARCTKCTIMHKTDPHRLNRSTLESCCH
jgi:hypothetical protein